MAALALRTGRDAGTAGKGSTSGKGSRGWQVLRDHWKDFLEKRPGIPDRVALEIARVDTAPQRASLSKEASDRILDKITAHVSQESPRVAAQIATWKRAKNLHYEVRGLLGSGMKPLQGEPPPLEERTLAGVGYAASALFPTQWWQALDAELLAELVVDAFASTFCDALLDGAVALLEAAEGRWGPPAQRPLLASASEPALGPARAPLPALSPPHGLASLAPAGPAAPRPGLAGALDSSAPGSEAWSTKRYHACQPLDSLKGRIHRNAELQRPRRRPAREGPEGTGDLRKFNWPMAATNFPDAWDKTTRRSRSKSGSAAGQRHAIDRGGTPDQDRAWLLDIGRDGKTTFPYSLASHRAFLEAQPDPVLKEKALKLAPLRMTGAW